MTALPKKHAAIQAHICLNKGMSMEMTLDL